MSYSISPLGDSALIVCFGNIISEEINSKVLLLVQAIEKAGLVAVKDVVPAYSSVAVYYDVIAIMKEHTNTSAFKLMSEQIETLLSQSLASPYTAFRNMQIPVCYSLKYGLDLADITEQTKLSAEEIINLHTSKKYKVYMIGFLPGFAYMGTVDERIAVPRKLEPRLRIEAGSVGIAGRQTGIYPLASPGGWQVVGRTPVKLFNKEKEDPVFFRAGDQVQFYSITEDEFDNY
jgi:inhibitor of KinA